MHGIEFFFKDDSWTIGEVFGGNDVGFGVVTPWWSMDGV
jgi:hypothetical protein